MKPSGIEWIGDIPDDWEVYRLKNEVVFVNGYAFDGSELHQDKEVPVIRIGDISSGVIDYSSTLKTNVKSGLSEYELRKNDILIAMSGATTGKTAIVKTNEKAYINQRVGIIRATKCNIFIKYLLETKGFFNYIFLVAGGSAQPNISMHNILNFPIPKIRLDTQQKIADYLDEKCGEIDATIAKQKESIEKLKAYKQSLISETVTKGLDKSAPLKPSGIEWIGDIPSHWEIKKLKFLVSLIDNKTKDGHSISLENIESGTGKLIETENTYDGEGISFKENDLLFGKLRPYLAKVYLSALKGRALGDFYVMRANKGTNPNFLKFVLLSDWFIKIVDSSTYGTKMPRASWDFTGGMRIPLPPISEQDCISSYLETKCSEVDTFIIEKQNIIQKLDAYKKSLIFECVTGKKRI